MEKSTGAVRLDQALSRDLPFGFSRWQVNVLAVDEPGSRMSKTGYGTISISLIDINDHTPVFDTCCLRGSMPEDSPPGKTVISPIIFINLNSFRRRF